MNHWANFNVLHRDGGQFCPAIGVSWNYPYHACKQHKFYYILSGHCTININGVDYTATPHQWFFIPAGTKHSYQNDPEQPFKKYWIEFETAPDPFFFSSFPLPPFAEISPRGKEHRLFRQYLSLCNSNSLSDQLTAKSLLLQLITAYLQLSSRQITAPRDTDWLSTAQAYIDTHRAERITNRELAAVLHVHPTHLIRLFKEKVGITPNNYVTTYKISLAKRLLLETDCTVGHIAEKLGFYDTAAFNKVFKKHTSLTPRQYRRAYRIT